MATKPVFENGAWAFRLRICGQDIYKTGFESAKAARHAEEELRGELRKAKHQVRRGPWETTLGEALLHYAHERLPKLKGGQQESRRINRFLRDCGAPTVKLEPVKSDPNVTAKSVVYWSVSLVPPTKPRRIANGLHEHRRQQAKRTSRSDALRNKLTRMPVGRISAFEVQAFIDAMVKEGLGAATIHLEVAVIRQLFSHADRTWQWILPNGNPAKNRDLPSLPKGRDRILTNQEWSRVSKALEESRNPYAVCLIALLLQTSMRSGESLTHALWEDYDVKRHVLKLEDSKTGRREVPLNEEAVNILERMRVRFGVRPMGVGRIFPITYEGLKKVWSRACERAEVSDVKLHDLRHTAATRFALQYSGNMPVLKLITGHKTDKMLLRYVNLRVDDVARLMHGEALDHDLAPAGFRVETNDANRTSPESLTDTAVLSLRTTSRQSRTSLPGNVIPFPRMGAQPS